jgi:hypothetical protein
MIDVTILKTAGLDVVAKWQRLPMKRTERTDNLGIDDIALMRKLVLTGDEHAKAMRMVVAWMLVRAPRYWWQQFDTYRIGVEKLSESTMHTLMRDGVRLKDFTPATPVEAFSVVQDYVRWKNFEVAKAALPEGFLQTRLVMASYQALRRMWLQRRSHKLAEWHEFLDALRELPLADELIFAEEQHDYSTD